MASSRSDCDPADDAKVGRKEGEEHEEGEGDEEYGEDDSSEACAEMIDDADPSWEFSLAVEDLLKQDRSCVLPSSSAHLCPCSIVLGRGASCSW